MLKQLLIEGREIDRIVDHWKKTGSNMTTAQLRDAIGEELEMLEYTPTQVERLLPQIVRRVQGK